MTCHIAGSSRELLHRNSDVNIPVLFELSHTLNRFVRAHNEGWNRVFHICFLSRILNFSYVFVIYLHFNCHFFFVLNMRQELLVPREWRTKQSSSDRLGRPGIPCRRWLQSMEFGTTRQTLHVIQLQCFLSVWFLVISCICSFS